MKNSFELMKERNKKKVMHYIYNYGPISRVEISEKIGLAPATVSNIVKKLLKSNLVKESKRAPSSGGRKPVLLEINASGVFFLGLKWGINSIDAVLLNLNAEIIASKTLNNNNYSLNNFLDITKKLIKNMEEESGNKEKIYGLGLGIHGPVNPHSGISLYAPHFKWENINIQEKLESLVDYPVFIDNDVRMMALGEKWGGVGDKAENFIYVNLDYGIGSGIVIKNELYYGNDWTAGEFGHMTVVDNGPLCSCGKRGCLEAVASIERITERYFENMENLTLEEKWDKFKVDLSKGEENALEIINEVANYLGTGLANLINLFNPEIVILGGEMMKISDFIYPTIEKKVKEDSLSIASKGNVIEKSGFGKYAGARGAGASVLEEFLA